MKINTDKITSITEEYVHSDKEEDVQGFSFHTSMQGYTYILNRSKSIGALSVGVQIIKTLKGPEAFEMFEILYNKLNSIRELAAIKYLNDLDYVD
jgi:hypothetical protein